MLSLIGQNIVTLNITSIIFRFIHLYYLYSIVYLRNYCRQKLCAENLILQVYTNTKRICNNLIMLLYHNNLPLSNDKLSIFIIEFCINEYYSSSSWNFVV